MQPRTGFVEEFFCDTSGAYMSEQKERTQEKLNYFKENVIS